MIGAHDAEVAHKTKSQRWLLAFCSRNKTKIEARLDPYLHQEYVTNH